MTYDLIVIGGGSGGIASARRSAEFGAKVLVIEQSELGGTCVNVGCVPKKVMWNAAHIATVLKDAKDYGISGQFEPLQWQLLQEKRNQYIERLNSIYATNLEKSNVDLIKGQARFVNSTTVSVNGKQYTCEKILLATGGRPYKLNIPGAEHAGTSNDFFTWKDCPQKVAVVGAGYIGVELAGVLQALGSEVTILCRRSLPLSNFDNDISRQLLEHMKLQGIKTQMSSQVKSIEKENDNYFIKLDQQTIGPFSKVLFATGRKPNTDNIGLENTKIQLTDWGHVKVDKYQNTNDPNIFAIGDIIGKIDLTPVAIAAGRKLAHRLFNKETGNHLNYDNVASVVFSHPPIGTVGLNEEQAIEQYGDKDIKVYRAEFVNMYYSMMSHKPKTFFKLICQGDDERIVGLHAIGDNVDEMLQGFSVALNMGATKSDFDNTVAIHPIAAEEFVTMR